MSIELADTGQRVTITVEQLIAAGVTPTQAKIFAEPISMACDRFSIQTPRQIAMFVAQARVESDGFSKLEESLYYTTALRLLQVWPTRFTGLADAGRFVRNPQALANHVYALRNGNGDEASGDGWLFRGRGFGITGRANYAAAAQAIGEDYLEHPELVSTPAHACLTFANFWTMNHLNIKADAGDVIGVTRAVNGPGMMALDERREGFTDGMRAFV